MQDLHRPLRTVKGIGPKRAEALSDLGYETVGDLLCRMPMRYEDRRRFVALAEVREGEKASFLATVHSPRLIRTRRRGLTIFEATLDDGSAQIGAVWFNQPYLAKTLVDGRSAYFFGELHPSRSGRKEPKFENPQFETFDPQEVEPIHSGRIVPIYQRIGTLSGKMIRSLIHGQLSTTMGEKPRAGEPDEFLPADLLERLGLPSRMESLREVHFPSPEASFEDLNGFRTPFHRRLIFEELFLLQLALAARRAAVRSEAKAFVYRLRPGIGAKLTAIPGFPLTAGQRTVLREIFKDLTSPHPMNRLLQGEVGSGKTIVAMLSMAFAAENGIQSALMAPTEILAEQHARSLEAALGGAGYRIVLLTSAVKGAERKARLRALSTGEAQIAVGTHALLENEVVFRRLGLVVVDEQHRFGVLQRARLIVKSQRARSSPAPPRTQPATAPIGAPDILLMTATPIPRTLAMTLYGDLDVSLLEEMPPGRSPVATLVRGEADRSWLYAWMRDEIARGRQAFVVYPLVEEREDSELRAASAMAKRLGAEVAPPGETDLAPCRVGLVHGKMKGRDKSAVMDAFRNGEIDILVATTVIEVGIDVPSVTALVIEHAERFGLSQLHQLRGRIGRGPGGGTCVLMAGENPTAEARVRLAAMEREHSGFRLAEIDFELRGPGEVLGTRQAGIPNLRMADLARDGAILTLARAEAFALIEAAGETRTPWLRELLARIPRAWRERIGLAGIG